MTTAPRPPSPLDADEQTLAKALHALPSGEPSPALDRRILQAAQDALAAESTPQTRRANPLPWGWATAATAVLAVGITWQMRPTPNQPFSAPATQEMAAPAQADALPKAQLETRRDAQKIAEEFRAESSGTRERENAAKSDLAVTPAMKPALPAKEKLISEPTPFADAEVLEQKREQARAVPAPPPPPEEPPVVFDEPTYDDLMPPPTYAPAAPSPAMELGKSSAAESGMAVEQDALTPPQEETQLAPDQWLEKIQQQLTQGDIHGARASLDVFRRKYPDHPVPPELLERLRE